MGLMLVLIQTPAYQASFFGYCDELQCLAELQADLNIPDSQGKVSERVPEL